MTQQDFLMIHLLDDVNYPDICARHGISLAQLREWWNDEQGLEIRTKIAKSNKLFNSRKGKAGFESLATKRQFYDWYVAQHDQGTNRYLISKDCVRL